MSKKVRLSMAIGLSTTFMIIEIVGGLLSGSLAVLSDAAHLLTDIFGFSLALLAVYLSEYAASEDYTFGLGRAEVVGALASVLTLWVMTGWLVCAAATRTYDWFQGTAEPVNGRFMFIVACLGVLVNICLSTVFIQEHGAGLTHDHSHGHCHHHTGVDIEMAKNGTSNSHDHSHGHSHGHERCHGHGNGHDHGHAHDSHEEESTHDHGHGHEHRNNCHDRGHRYV